MGVKETVQRLRQSQFITAREEQLGEMMKAHFSDMVTYCSATKTEFASDFFPQIVASVREGRQTIVAARHLSVVDGALLTRNVARFLKPILEDEGWRLAMVVTGAFATGHQGKFLQVLSPEMEKQAKIYGVDELWPVLRPKDVAMGIEPTSEHKESLRNLKNAAKNKFAVMLFPEGTVEGGRKVHPYNPFSHELKGMQDIQIDTLGRMVEWAAQADRGITFIPVAIEGTNEIFNPDFLLPTAKAVASTFLRRHFGTVSVRVGTPVNGKEIMTKLTPIYPDRKQRNVKVGRIIGSTIAEMLPEQEQGFYRLNHNLYGEVA